MATTSKSLATNDDEPILPAIPTKTRFQSRINGPRAYRQGKQTQRA